MPTRNEITNRRDRYARQSERQSDQRYNRMSSGLWGSLGLLLDTLATDERGRIVFNVRNISTANRIGIAVQAFNVQNGFGFLRWVYGRLRSILGLNNDYFKTMPDIQPETVEDRVRRLLLSRYGFNPNNGELDPDGYLAANVRQSGQGQAIAERINQAIASKMSLNDFKRQFRQDFQKPGSPLSLEYHYNRFTRDLFQEFDRTTQLVYADELGMEHAIYSGTAKNNTRCFCLRRLNRIYEDDFMAEWNSQDWKGKKPGVDVRIALGGYNCRHVLSWITEGTADQLAQRREQKFNTYNETDC